MQKTKQAEEWTESPASWVNCSWYKCDLCDHEHLSQQGAGYRGGAVVESWETRKIKKIKLKGNTNRNGIKNRLNDPLVSWLESKHSILQFTYHQVLFPLYDKVRTLGRASDKRKNLQHLWEKIMTWQNKHRKWISRSLHPWRLFGGASWVLAASTHFSTSQVTPWKLKTLPNKYSYYMG